MVYPHVTLPDELDKRIRDYALDHGIKYSLAVQKLIEAGLDKSDTNRLVEMNNTFLERINSRQNYMCLLLEQFYSDMDFDNLSNPRINKALQKFKSTRDKENM